MDSEKAIAGRTSGILLKQQNVAVANLAIETHIQLIEIFPPK